MSPEYAAEWFRKAEADRVAAESCLKVSRRFESQAEIVAFHAQQCAEKYLKGLLALEGTIVPRTHDLLVLARMIKKTACRALRPADLRRLNAYAVEIRYPGATATRAEAVEARRAMERIRLACRAALKEAGAPSGARRPLRSR